MGKRTSRAVAVAAAAVAWTLFVPGVAQAAAAISLAGDARISASRTLTVPIEASCDAVGQETTFIVVTVNQGRTDRGRFVEGQGDVLDVPCDSAAHSFDVVVTADKGTWHPGTASLTAIISYCVPDGGSLSCTTQAFIPFGTPVTLARA